MDVHQTVESQRLDKWLKIVRLFKKRKLAADACDKRLVKVNDVTSKASKNVVVGDEIIIRLRGRYRSFKVLGISKRSVSAKEARELYEETTNSHLTPEQKELVALSMKTSKRDMPEYPGRPTKKSRRELEKWKSAGFNIPKDT